jgi:aminopeptidase N
VRFAWTKLIPREEVMFVVGRGNSLPVLLALVAVLGACDVAPIPTDSGIPWDLAEHRSRTILGLSYRISLEIPEERSEPIQGRSLISFGWTDPDAQPLVLDFMKPGERVHTVVVNGSEAIWEPVNDHIVISSDLLREGMNEVDLTYDVGDEAFNRNDDFLYALFVPDRAHFSLPVFDQPNLKAPVRWRVSAPPGWKVVANGPATERTDLNGRQTTNFLETKPIPTYLFAVAAGKFQEETEILDGRLFRMYHRETDSAKVARNRDEAFRLHAASVAWLEEYTGIEYPFQKFDFVLIPSFQYGGMEHPGGILYRQGGVLLDETATQGQILGRASVIAHETAHMWFGDLVTMNWFDDVWTKEVFANFMAAKIVHPSFPEIDHDLRFMTGHHPSAYGVDRTDGANPIRQPLDNLRFAGTLYGSIIYAKAPIVMRHLEARVGEETFRDGLREYLSTFSYGNATWPDLIEILDALSPEDLSAWSRVWVEEPGRPTITVERDGPDAVITQADPSGQGRVWPQTLHVRSGSIDSNALQTIELGADPVRIAGAGSAGFILPNGSGLEYGGFVLDSGSQAYLVENVSDADEALVRGAIWVMLWDQVLEGRLEPSTFLTRALSALTTETDELVVDRLLGYVSSSFWRLLSSSERKQWAPDIESLLWSQVNSDRPRTARSSFYGSYRGLATTDDGVARLRRLWSGDESVRDLPLSEPNQIALANGLAIRRAEGFEEILTEQESRIQNPDRLARFQFVRPSLSADPAERDAFFASLADRTNREREPWVLSGLGNLHHPLRAGESLHLIRPALDMIEEIQRTGDIFFPGRWLGATLGGHGSAEAAETVQDFLDQSADLSPRMRLKVLQSADMVFRSARIVHGRN